MGVQDVWVLQDLQEEVELKVKKQAHVTSVLMLLEHLALLVFLDLRANKESKVGKEKLALRDLEEPLGLRGFLEFK
uniref:Uncharacterized protein n=1 Tax=Sphaerodactylus townsendi TaxID=933632 RepID=A0ACB8FAT5_9SAUR